MTPEEVQRFRQLLVARRDELQQVGDVRLDPLRDDAVGKIDDDLQPLNEMNQVIASNRNKDRAVALRRIEVALQRLDDAPEEYGACEACGDDIPPRRLELMPWVTLCVECQSEREEPTRGGTRRHLTDYR
jgi:DnaK suppressor protein